MRGQLDDNAQLTTLSGHGDDAEKNFGDAELVSEVEMSLHPGTDGGWYGWMEGRSEFAEGWKEKQLGWQGLRTTTVWAGFRLCRGPRTCLSPRSQRRMDIAHQRVEWVVCISVQPQSLWSSAGPTLSELNL